MTNSEIGIILKEISELMELKGENSFKSRAYRRAARQIEIMPEDLTRLIQENRLRQVSGIGTGISVQVEELVKNGQSSLLEELRSEVPTGLRRILGIPGVGVKTAQKLYYELGISSLLELKDACEQNRIKSLPGFGEKSQQKILRGISKVESSERGTLLGIALPMSRNIISILEGFPEVSRAAVTGSVRRKMEVVKDIDIVIETQSVKTVKEKITELPAIYQILEEHEQVLSVLNTVGLRLDFYFTSEKLYYHHLFLATGNEGHIKKIADLAKQHGYSLTGAGYHDPDGKLVPLQSEQELYHSLNIPYIIPELREDRYEINAAINNELPSLVTCDNLKGDLHVHTDWSDGAASLEQMVNSAYNKGYQYIVITDHSKSLRIANGLSERELADQIEEINKINEQFHDLKVFTGTEVDILKNGELDFSQEILNRLDFVIASIHQDFDAPGGVITDRICKAMECPAVSAIGHPSGRILGKRPGHELDMERIFNYAAATNTVLEINSSIDRLDLSEEVILLAQDRGVKFLISTDAHSETALKDIEYGVYVARRAWLKPEKIINTYDIQDFQANLLSGV